MEASKPNPLEEEVFTYRVAKGPKVFIAWQGRDIMTLKDDAAQKLLARLAAATPQEVQLALAKATRNFKHGNER